MSGAKTVSLQKAALTNHRTHTDWWDVFDQIASALNRRDTDATSNVLITNEAVDMSLQKLPYLILPQEANMQVQWPVPLLSLLPYHFSSFFYSNMCLGKESWRCWAGGSLVFAQSMAGKAAGKWIYWCLFVLSTVKLRMVHEIVNRSRLGEWDIRIDPSGGGSPRFLADA